MLPGVFVCDLISHGSPCVCSCIYDINRHPRHSCVRICVDGAFCLCSHMPSLRQTISFLGEYAGAYRFSCPPICSRGSQSLPSVLTFGRVVTHSVYAFFVSHSFVDLAAARQRAVPAISLLPSHFLPVLGDHCTNHQPLRR